MIESAESNFERIKKIRESELALKPIAKSIEDIPVSYELINPVWLTKTICGSVPGAEVVDFSLDEPDEGTSNRRRIFLCYNQAGIDAGLPETVFCKATQSIESRFQLGQTKSAEGEVLFYQHVRPLIPDIEAPVCLFSNADADSWNSIVILQDLRGEVEFCDHNTTISLNHAKSQMRLLAKLHGKFYDSKDFESVTGLFLTYDQWCENVERVVGWSGACARGFQAAEQVIPERLFKRHEEIWPATEKAWGLHKKLPSTFLHNDVHLKNWYITKTGEMGLNDWQCCARGHWSHDLAYSMATSLSVDKRRDWERSLIKYYLENLVEFGAPAVSFDEALLMYRQQLFPALGMWTGTLAPAPGSPEMQPPETSIEFIKRISHAIDDLDALESFE